MINKDVVIIGGGPAGMAAAISLKKQGIQDILLVEREAALGGILNQCIHDGFGLIHFEKNLTGPEYGEIYEKQLTELGIDHLTGASVTAITPQKQVTVATASGQKDYLAKAVILATGCRERPRGALSIPGTRPAGIYTAGTAQNFVNLRNLMPGKRVMILGSGDIGLIMARRLTLEGAQVIAVVEKEKAAGGLPRNVLQCLKDFDIPLILGATITNIMGIDRVEAVEVCMLDEDGSPMKASAKLYACDTLILSVGLIPEVETGLTCGITLDEHTGEPLTDEMGQTTVEGVFVCGNARYVHDLVDDVSSEAEGLGIKVADYIQKKTSHVEAQVRASARPKTNDPNTMICLLCPNSCAITYNLPEIKGAKCEKGEEYIIRELISPMRTLTTSVKVLNAEKQIVSVRTSGGIPKEAIFSAMNRIRTLKVEAPVEIGQIIEKDFMTFGVDLIATSKVL